MGREDRFSAVHLLTATAISLLLAMFLAVIFGIDQECHQKYEQITIIYSSLSS